MFRQCFDDVKKTGRAFFGDVISPSIFLQLINKKFHIFFIVIIAIELVHRVQYLDADKSHESSVQGFFRFTIFCVDELFVEFRDFFVREITKLRSENVLELRLYGI